MLVKAYEREEQTLSELKFVNYKKVGIEVITSTRIFSSLKDANTNPSVFPVDIDSR